MMIIAGAGEASGTRIRAGSGRNHTETQIGQAGLQMTGKGHTEIQIAQAARPVTASVLLSEKNTIINACRNIINLGEFTSGISLEASRRGKDAENGA
jgi:hypothetical protein